MMTRLLIVAAGGAVGAMARYSVGVWAFRLFPAAHKGGTLGAPLLQHLAQFPEPLSQGLLLLAE